MLCALQPLLLLAPAPALPAAPQEELLTLWTAEAAHLLRHPKDQGLLRVLDLLGPRLAELPTEVPELAGLPPEAMQTVAHVLRSAKGLRLGYDDLAGLVPLALQVDWELDDPAAAAEASEGLQHLAQLLGASLPSPDDQGWTAVPAPLPLPLGFGPRGSAVSLNLGRPFDGPVDTACPDLPEGVRPDLLLRMDVALAMDLLLEGLALSGSPEADLAELIIGTLELDVLRLELASGSDEQRTHTVLRLADYGASLRRMGVIPEQGLSLDHLRLVPVDAGSATVATLDLGGLLDLVLGLMEEGLADQGIDDPLEMVAQTTGVHLERDILDHLGPVLGVYTSDTTGGGGLLSTVAFQELRDPAGLLPFVERMVALADGVGLAELDGYLQVRPWEHGEVRYWTLASPGLPLPLELTLALTDRYLFVGASPQAALAAVAQATGREASLLDHPGFQAQLPVAIEGATQVSFLDTPRYLSDGYGPMLALTAALTNGTRSRRDASRDAGLVLPAFHDLRRGALAWVTVERVEGEDYVVRGRSDASLAVNATGLLGSGASALLSLSLAAGWLTFAQQTDAQAAFVHPTTSDADPIR